MATKDYLTCEYEIVSAGDNPIVNARFVQCADERLDEVLRELGNDTEVSDGRLDILEANMAKAESDITNLDERVTILEEQGGGGGSDYPPEGGIPETDLSENVKLKLNKDLGTQCSYELNGTTLNITLFEDDRFGDQCTYSVSGTTLTITPKG